MLACAKLQRENLITSLLSVWIICENFYWLILVSCQSLNLFVFPVIPYLFWRLYCNVHRVRKSGAMSKLKCCKIAPVFEIQHDVLFRRISVRQLRMTDRTQNMTYHLLTIQSNCATFHFLPCPQFTHPTHMPQWYNHNKYGINRKANK